MKLLQRILSDAVLIESATFNALMLSRGHYAESVQQLADSSFVQFMREDTRPKMTIDGDIAIVPITGILAKAPDIWELFQGTSDSDQILQLLNDAYANPAVKGVLLDVDSPGGYATSLDLADRVASLRQQMPVVAHTSGMMASLAYYVGSQASMIVSARTALVGSIGVYSHHVDLSRLYDDAGISVEVFKNKEAAFKAAGLLGTELTDEQRQQFVERAQGLFDDFKSKVRASRRNVPDGAMRGQTFYGGDAKGIGLVDVIGSRGFAKSLLRSQIRKLQSSSL